MNEQDACKEIQEFYKNLPKSVQKSIIVILEHIKTDYQKYDELKEMVGLLSGQIGRLEEMVGSINSSDKKSTIDLQSETPKANPTTRVERESIGTYLRKRFPDSYNSGTSYSILARRIAEAGIVPEQNDSFQHSHYHFLENDEIIKGRIDNFVLEHTRKRKNLQLNPPEKKVEYVTNKYLFEKLGLNGHEGITNSDRSEDLSFGDLTERFGAILGRAVKIPEGGFGYSKKKADEFIGASLEYMKK